jgi:hypothetical protein
MPGKKGIFGSFMTSPAIYRQDIVAADTNTEAAIEALPELDLGRPVDPVYPPDALSCDYTVGNLIHCQVCVPSTVTQFDIEVWGTINDGLVVPVAGYRWAQVDGLEDRHRSSFITIADIPATKIKILITNITGNFGGGPGCILFSRSA